MNATDALHLFQRPGLDDLDETNDVIDWVAAYIASEDFDDAVNAFCDKYASEFASVQEDENKLEWSEYHKEFLQVTEGKIEDFLQSKGFTLEQFSDRTKEENEKAEQNQRHSRQSTFLSLLAACSEFENFVFFMKRASDPHAQLRSELMQKAEEYQQMAQRQAKEGLLSEMEVDKVLNATDRMITFLENFPTSSLSELQEEETFMKNICVPLFE